MIFLGNENLGFSRLPPLANDNAKGDLERDCLCLREGSLYRKFQEVLMKYRTETFVRASEARINNNRIVATSECSHEADG